ncbi:MAG: PEP-CTERM sorting domain-containing protein [Microcoleaceae cyanobacterium]
MKNLTAKIIGASILTAGLLSVSATGAAALTLQGNNCSTGNLTGSASCEGTFNGNDANQNLDGLFGQTGWSQLFKVDNSSGTNGGLTVTADNEKTGTWSLSGADTSQYDYMAVIKGGNSFSAYSLNDFSGNWNTDGVVKGNGRPNPGLSHFTVYSIAKSNNSEEVPEPLTILGSGLALGFGAMFKKKHSNKA